MPTHLTNVYVCMCVQVLICLVSALVCMSVITMCVRVYV